MANTIVWADIPVTDMDRALAFYGATAYLGSGGDIEGMAARTVAAGGQILMPPTHMGEVIGTIAFIRNWPRHVATHGGGLVPQLRGCRVRQ